MQSLHATFSYINHWLQNQVQIVLTTFLNLPINRLYSTREISWSGWFQQISFNFVCIFLMMPFLFGYLMPFLFEFLIPFFVGFLKPFFCIVFFLIEILILFFSSFFYYINFIFEYIFIRYVCCVCAYKRNHLHVFFIFTYFHQLYSILI